MSRRTKYIVREVPVASADSGAGSAHLLVGFIAGVMFGALGGYVLGSQALAPRGTAPAAVAAVAPASALTPAVNEQELQTYRSILANDPKNVRAAVELGNRLYDAGRFSEAVPYYQQAFALDPTDVSVSTDLGTSLWNAGRADEALAQFDKSLAIDPKHPQTLFNIGIVRRNGKQDAAGAVAAWQKLLSLHPSYAERTRVEQLIADARASMKPVSGTR